MRLLSVVSFHLGQTYHKFVTSIDSVLYFNMTPTKTFPTSSFSYYNDLAIAYLEEGHHEEAVRLLKEAAKLMYTLTLSCANKDKSSRDEPECQNVIDSKSAPESHNIPRRPMISSMTENNSFICSRPIFLSNGDTSSNYHEESAVILYNMALAYHLNSICANRFPKALDNAIKLFEMAYNLSLRVGQTERTSLIVMSSLNNLGLLHYDQGDFTNSNECFEDLFSYISSLDTPVEKSIAIERNGFLINAMVLTNQMHGAAAA